jgi:serine/threonine-protein kinase HipA
MTTATVRLWDADIGAVTWREDRQSAVFQYTPELARSTVRLAPLMMPPSTDLYEFPGLPKEAFKGLPGMLADSLPDKFGNALIDAWLATQGRLAESFNPVERLCYIGTRGMGALEFHPATPVGAGASRKLDIDALVALATQVLNNRAGLAGYLTGKDDHHALQEILRVGTSAGGARAKAILAWNEATGEFRSGQVSAGEGFTYWLLKFDGVTNNRDKELADPQGFGRIEYAFYLLARAAGISMNDCRLHEEGGRAHFMTRRFDRSDTGRKLHMQSLAAMRHFDFNNAGAYSYEQAIETIRLLDLPATAIHEQFRRAVFNLQIRNQDDHVKNIAFIMDQTGHWRLSPAFDVCFAYNPGGSWTHQHQMSMNGKRDHFEPADLMQFAKFCSISPKRARQTIDEVHHSLRAWPTYADCAGIPTATANAIQTAMRRELTWPGA